MNRRTSDVVSTFVEDGEGTMRFCWHVLDPVSFHRCLDTNSMLAMEVVSQALEGMPLFPPSNFDVVRTQRAFVVWRCGDELLLDRQGRTSLRLKLESFGWVFF